MRYVVLILLAFATLVAPQIGAARAAVPAEAAFDASTMQVENGGHGARCGSTIGQASHSACQGDPGWPAAASFTAHVAMRTSPGDWNDEIALDAFEPSGLLDPPRPVRSTLPAPRAFSIGQELSTC